MGSRQRAEEIFRALDIPLASLASGEHRVYSPVDGQQTAALGLAGADELGDVIERSRRAFKEWRDVPAPRRGEVVRAFGDSLRAHKSALAALVTMESGKIYSEALGEVQEMIDICDFAVGLSRQLYGRTMGSERRGHKLVEYWHPMGVVGVISAFNFPVAVWSWNLTIALVCGNAVIWKPSEKTPLTAIACDALLRKIFASHADVPEDLHQLFIGGAQAGRRLAEDPGVAVVSATGSTAMGREVAPIVARRFGRCILELGGNNAMIVTPSANLAIAAEAVVFAAVGTAGQRCTSLRRVIAHESIIETLMDRIVETYDQIRVGNPFDERMHMGPMIDGRAYEALQTAVSELSSLGYHVEGGGRMGGAGGDGTYYVRPAVVRVDADHDGLQNELFAPLLYVTGYGDLGDAIELQNDVPQGLSSSIFTNDIRESERFLSHTGSDCGIANVNTGPSGAEIGGAFGGEKDTGGGRESGSDAWKGYMRRLTATINYSDSLPLAQDVSFGVDSVDGD
ncbi:MAG: aldehyde dehydrogenase family protein [Gammaproteobacteria bacterium]|nr:aldehyde dehydrogenase family protein [Gammaproteobacteria bacterium]